MHARNNKVVQTFHIIMMIKLYSILSILEQIQFILIRESFYLDSRWPEKWMFLLFIFFIIWYVISSIVVNPKCVHISYEFMNA